MGVTPVFNFRTMKRDLCLIWPSVWPTTFSCDLYARLYLSFTSFPLHFQNIKFQHVKCAMAPNVPIRAFYFGLLSRLSVSGSNLTSSIIGMPFYFRTTTFRSLSEAIYLLSASDFLITHYCRSIMLEISNLSFYHVTDIKQQVEEEEWQSLQPLWNQVISHLN